MPRQRKDRADDNQKQIVADLRMLGYSVITGMDDLIVGIKGRSFWYEVKRPESRSKRTGLILDSFIKPSQKKLQVEYKGHYALVTCTTDILKDIDEQLKQGE